VTRDTLQTVWPQTAVECETRGHRHKGAANIDDRCVKSGTGIAQRYSAVLRSGYRGFESRQELGIFLFTTLSIPALGPTQCVPGG
jgi:hypothetical protein